MPVETPTIFAQVIRDHLDLKRQNADLDPVMPLDRYKSEDPFDNHPLFKTEEQARLEETKDGVEPEVVSHVAPWPGENGSSAGASSEELWGRSRDFDWGD